jgi:SAM-dependent methyltransferase
VSLLGRLRRFLLPSLDLLHLERRRVLRLVPPGARVLDAGCGEGDMALLLARRGHRVLGVSCEAEAVARADARAEGTWADFHVHDLETDGPPGEGFDVALCLDVLEHIEDDRAALRAVAASLRPGGRLLLTVPSRDAPPLPGDRVTQGDGGHVRPGYSRDDLSLLLAGVGLRPVGCRGFGGFFTQKIMCIARRLERRRGRVATLVRVLWLLCLRPLTLLDPLVPWPPYELLVVADRAV